MIVGEKIGLEGEIWIDGGSAEFDRSDSVWFVIIPFGLVWSGLVWFALFGWDWFLGSIVG